MGQNTLFEGKQPQNKIEEIPDDLKDSDIEEDLEDGEEGEEGEYNDEDFEDEDEDQKDEKELEELEKEIEEQSELYQKEVFKENNDTENHPPEQKKEKDEKVKVWQGFEEEKSSKILRSKFK